MTHQQLLRWRHLIDKCMTENVVSNNEMMTLYSLTFDLSIREPILYIPGRLSHRIDNQFMYLEIKELFGLYAKNYLRKSTFRDYYYGFNLLRNQFMLHVSKIATVTQYLSRHYIPANIGKPLDGEKIMDIKDLGFYVWNKHLDNWKIKKMFLYSKLISFIKLIQIKNDLHQELLRLIFRTLLSTYEPAQIEETIKFLFAGEKCDACLEQKSIFSIKYCSHDSCANRLCFRCSKKCHGPTWMTSLVSSSSYNQLYS